MDLFSGDCVWDEPKIPEKPKQRKYSDQDPFRTVLPPTLLPWITSDYCLTTAMQRVLLYAHALFSVVIPVSYTFIMGSLFRPLGGSHGLCHLMLGYFAEASGVVPWGMKRVSRKEKFGPLQKPTQQVQKSNIVFMFLYLLFTYCPAAKNTLDLLYQNIPSAHSFCKC